MTRRRVNATLKLAGYCMIAGSLTDRSLWVFGMAVLLVVVEAFNFYEAWRRPKK
jgi:hypothetical protein